MQSDPRVGWASQAGARTAEVDAGLRAYMLKVYNYMACGVALTGVVAYATALFAQSSPGFAQMLYGSPLAWVVMLAPLGFVFAISFGINKFSTGTTQVLFWLFAGVMGLSLSSIFLVYTGTSIARVFFVSAGAFAGLSLFGYVTKKDLSGFGTFLMMGLIGIVIASIVNIFIESTMMHFIISVVGVLVFAGLTAYDTQRIKNSYFMLASVDGGTAEKIAISGALSLYLNFINLFMMLLSLFGNRE